MLWLSKSLLFFIFYSHFISSSSSSSSSSVRPQCRPEARTALLNLNYTKSDINTSTDCCTWPYVMCDAKTGHVTSLNSCCGFLKGKITPKSPLFSLRHLQRLEIFGGRFKVEIGPDVFGTLTRNLTSLKKLTLLHVNMSLVPPESLINLPSSLTSLRIISCELSGKLPKTFFRFPKLVELDLSENKLRGQLLEFCATTSMASNCLEGRISSHLTTLTMYSNSFGGPIPSWIYALPNLERLDLSNNLFTGAIGEFRTSSLSELSLAENKLHGVIRRSLFQQMELEKLDLSSNYNLTGIVELQEFSKLFYLDLSYINLTVIDKCTNCTFKELWFLNLSSCNLTEFPHFFRSSNLLTSLDLSNNHIQGIVPEWLRELTNLYILDLRSNLLLGPLPIFSPSLTFFFASKNQFSGEIPCSVFNVEVVDLSYNNLSGRIPQCIGNVEYLSVLDLRSNKLHGEIPESLCKKEIPLRNLNLNGNKLEGQLPRSLINCVELEVVDLGNNELNDTFPDWLESLPELRVLVLRGNKLHGSIGDPNPGFPFRNLSIMDLSHNDFTGALPTKYFDNFKTMQMETRDLELSYVGERRGYVSYYHNSVTLTMKGFELQLERILTIFTTVDFSSNNFTGEIPELLGKLKSLKGLNLSHNALTGILPPSLGNLTNIEWLDLSSNELVGKIPIELADIPWLSNLNLSYNHLEGPIPQGKQFNTFRNESFEGNLNLCGFPLSKSCGGGPNPSEPSLEQDDDDDDDSSNITNGFNWRIVMMGFASGLVIGVSIGYMLLYSNGKLHWLSGTILEEIEFRRAMRSKRRKARRSQRK